MDLFAKRSSPPAESIPAQSVAASITNKVITNRLITGQPTAARSTPRSDDGLGRGMEFALVVLVFLGAGYVLDRWFGTKPVFMIILVVLALVGQFATLWYGYDARMRHLEAERAAGSTSRRPGSPTSPPGASSKDESES